MEQRICPVIVRALGNMRIAGTASVTYDGTEGTEYPMGRNIYERIAPGAWDEVLRQPRDIVATFNHNFDNLLGRTPATLRVSAALNGNLEYELDLPDTTMGRDLYTLIERGDVKGSSFFAMQGFIEWSKENGKDIRTIKRFKALYELGPVVMPAYSGTSSMLRGFNLNEVMKERDDYYTRLETAARLERARKLLG